MAQAVPRDPLTNPVEPVEMLLGTALEACRSGDEMRSAALEAIAVPIYQTDADGLVTYWNRACAEFAGRKPRLGKDRWCVTWSIHTTSDEPLPHDECPMAVAIKEKREVRDEVAIAICPDGSRKAFRPYPTPLFGENGELVGAINLLVDVSEEQAGELAQQATRCRRLAGAMCDLRTSEILKRMAEGYEVNARALQAGRS